MTLDALAFQRYILRIGLRKTVCLLISRMALARGYGRNDNRGLAPCG